MDSWFTVQEMIAKMRADSIHTVIITNGHAEIQQTKLKACKAVDLFNGILVGGEEVLAGRHEKPHPSIFLAACKLSNCQPEEVRNSPLFMITCLPFFGRDEGLHTLRALSRLYTTRYSYCKPSVDTIIERQYMCSMSFLRFEQSYSYIKELMFAVQAVHIGDNLVTDIMGGNNAGLKATIWVDRQNRGFSSADSKPECRPSYIVQHVTDLEKLMQRLQS